MAKRKAHAREPVNHDSTIHVCQLCLAAGVEPVVETTTFADFLAHVVDAHGLTEQQVRSAKGTMTAHLDAADWYQTDYLFKLADGRALMLRSVRLTRRTRDYLGH